MDVSTDTARQPGWSLDPEVGAGIAWLSGLTPPGDSGEEVAGRATPDDDLGPYEELGPQEDLGPDEDLGPHDYGGRDGVGPSGPVRGGWPGVGSGEVMTWLPSGRWVRGEPEEVDLPPTPDPEPEPDPRSAARRRGQRQVALARIGARLAGWPRRAAVGLLLAAAAVLALRPAPGDPPAAPAALSTDVVVAAHDLAAGTTLAAADLRVVSMPSAVVPAGASRRAAGLIGRTAAGAVRRGEPLTDARIVGPGLTAGLRPGESAAVPVRLADPDAAALIRPGDRVDVLGTAVTPDGSQATAGGTVAVVSAVRVLAVLGARDPADGVVLVVATTPAGARGLAGAAAGHRLTASVRGP